MASLGRLRFVLSRSPRRASDLLAGASPEPFRPRPFLRAERLQSGLVGRQVRPFDQVDAVGDGGEDRVETFADRPRLPRQIDDQGAPADAGRLPRKDGGWHFLERYL